VDLPFDERRGTDLPQVFRGSAHFSKSMWKEPVKFFRIHPDHWKINSEAEIERCRAFGRVSMTRRSAIGYGFPGLLTVRGRKYMTSDHRVAGSSPAGCG
jgi:hypothetical protein